MKPQPTNDHDTILDDAVNALRDKPVPDGPSPQLKQSILQAGHVSPPAHHQLTLTQRIRTMLPRTRYAAVAAAILVAGVMAIGLFFHNTGSVAWADVVDNVRNTSTVVLSFTPIEDGQPVAASRLMVREPDLIRIETPEFVGVLNRATGRSVSFHHDRKEAIEVFLTVKEFDVYNWLKRLPETSIELLGSRMIDERPAVGFRLTDLPDDFGFPGKPQEWHVWVDPETKLPVQLDGYSPPGQLAATITQIHFDVPLDHALFDMTIPDDYTVQYREGVPAEGLNPPQPTDNDLTLTPLVGLGPIEFGMTAEQVIAAIGEPDESKFDGVDLRYQSRGFSVAVPPSVGLTIINCYSSEAFGGVWAINDFAGRTDKGIRMGASHNDIVAAYGEPDSQTDAGGIVSLKYEMLKLTFGLKNDQLVQLWAFGPRPSRDD
ncbi:MAG: hypothetical protein CMJ49_07995 [Planctomycetaceae bacterium]|nr:hypothetical protein [Planctomycetaceae bacterium]